MSWNKTVKAEYWWLLVVFLLITGSAVLFNWGEDQKELFRAYRDCQDFEQYERVAAMREQSLVRLKRDLKPGQETDYKRYVKAVGPLWKTPRDVKEKCVTIKKDFEHSQHSDNKFKTVREWK